MIDISGGEPFYTPQFKHLVNKLVEHDYKGRLKVITNLTLLDTELLEKLKKINTTLIVSMDATGHLYEYVRPSTPFGKYKGQDIQNKIIELKHEHNLDMAISYTPQLFNVYNIQEYIDWLQFAKIRPRHEFMFNGPVVHPRYLTIAVHPDMDYKLRLADMLERDFGKGGRLNGVINLCRKPRDNEELDNWKFFCKITSMLDKHRKTSIINYIPQLEKYWVKNV
jgi:MoaA/NifB/PqqE/SkfB family radical SAM enzyme